MQGISVRRPHLNQMGRIVHRLLPLTLLYWSTVLPTQLLYFAQYPACLRISIVIVIMGWYRRLFLDLRNILKPSIYVICTAAVPIVIVSRCLRFSDAYKTHSGISREAIAPLHLFNAIKDDCAH